MIGGGSWEMADAEEAATSGEEVEKEAEEERQRPLRSRIARKEALNKERRYALGCALLIAIALFFCIDNLLCMVGFARMIPLGREEGLQGSKFLIHDLNFLQIRHLNREGPGLGQRGKPWVEVLSWEPRAFRYHNFLSLEETEYLRQLSKSVEFEYSEANLPPRGQPYNRKFAHVKTLHRKIFRGVYKAYLERGQYKVIRDIEKRISDFTLIPPEHGEGLEITKIHSGMSYYPHLDYFSNESDIRSGGGQRIATMIIFLNVVGTGGEAIFPAARGNFSSLPRRDQLSECGKEGGLAVKPKEGDALFFWNVRPDGMPDPSSLHGHCRVSNGRGRLKMICVKQFRAHEH